ncbi:NmrA family transcriptional regulator [Burkholderia sp. WAC0059]|uniref:NmrA family NAD(P)-binding protein n=1 Tax=Burkholderia sp. WAC0059 TaxID=2066022 RepID=UPI000C7E8B25|nr:NmrA family NAD(P)-binding protein [Burkholderia sp. WAC0059]PLZ00944.1 NmrA family transcriptional regulator [Burkholderia sp. WAC0059]
MYVITGITGQVGGVVARTLLAAGHDVRAVVRDTAKGDVWAKQGCEVAVADMFDAAPLAKAFKGAEAVFLLLPPSFDPQPGFPEVRKLADTLSVALREAQPGRIVSLSTIGAQATEENLLSQLGLIEKTLGSLPTPVTFLRPGWFMENTLWDIAPAKEHGVIQSFLQPLDHLYPMVATADVGSVAAELLTERWDGKRVVELVGPGEGVSPYAIAEALGRLLGCAVRAEAVPRDQWESLFRSQGMKNPIPRIRMLDGFNEGWIRFEHTPRRGSTTLDQVLLGLMSRTA